MLPPTTSGYELTSTTAVATRTPGQALVPAGNEALGVPTVWAPGGPSRPPGLSAGPDLINLWHALRRRMPLGIGIGLAIGVLLALLTWLVAPSNIEVAAYIEVLRATPKVFNEDPRAGRDFAEFDVFKQTIGQVIINPFVLNAALNRPGVSNLSLIRQESDPQKWLQENVKVPPTEGEVVMVSLKTDRPHEAVDILNAVVEAFQTEYVEAKKRDNQNRLQVLENERAETDAERKRNASVIERTLNDLGTIDPETARVQHSSLINELSVIRQARNHAEQMILEQNIKISGLEVQIRAEEQKPVQAQDLAIEQYLSQDPQVRQLEELLLNFRLQYEGMRAVLSEGRDDDVRLANLMLQIANTEDQIDARKAELRPTYAQMLVQNNAEPLKIELQKEQDAKAQFEARLKNLSDELQLLERRTEKVGLQSADLQRIEQKQDLLNRTYERIDSLMTELRIEQAAPARVRVLQRATVPPSADTKWRWLIVGFGGLMGVLVGMVGVAFWEFQWRRVSSVSEISEGLGMRVVGALPSLAGAGWRKKKGAAGETQQALSESINAVRAALLHSAQRETLRVVLVTSALHGEGKTTLASQLAASIARAGRRTLLVDGDLRNPTLNRLFELPLEPGLCEVLRGEAAVEDVIRPTRVNGLWLIAAGHSCRESIEALAKPAIREVFDHLRPNFDFVIVDGGAVLPAADTLLLGQQTDGAILSVLRDVSSMPKVYEAYERLQAVGINVLGTVVGGMQASSQERARQIPVRAAS